MKVVIIDDEPDAIVVLTETIKRCDVEVAVVGTATNPIDGAKLIRKEKPDVVFMDIQMPGGTGFDVLEIIETIDFKVVFVTAYDQYALQAIKHNAFDYLLKPIDTEELSKVLGKAQARQHSPGLYSEMKHNWITNSKITIAANGGHRYLDVDEISYVEADGSYSKVYVNEEEILVSKRLRHFDDLLTPKGFARIHASFLINLNYVKLYQKSIGKVTLKTGAELSVSKSQKAVFEELMNELLR